MIIFLRLFEYKNFVNLVVKDKIFFKGFDFLVFIFLICFLFFMLLFIFFIGEIFIEIINLFMRNLGFCGYKLCGSFKMFGDDISWVEFSRYVILLFRFIKEFYVIYVIVYLVIKFFCFC